MDRHRERLCVILALFVGLIVRLYAGRGAFIGGDVLFSGYDEYYHMRRIFYTAAHFPQTLWFDSYLDYPKGFEITWPPLFDYLSAGMSLLLGGGTHQGIETVSALLPPVIGALTIVAVYYVVKRIFGQRVALMSAFLTAVAPYNLVKTMAAATDHHGLETLLLVLIFLGIAGGFEEFTENRVSEGASRPGSRNQKRKRIKKTGKNGGQDSIALTSAMPGLKAGWSRQIVSGIIAGVAMAALAMTWRGAAVYFVFVLAYAAINVALDLRKGRATDLRHLILAVGLATAIMLPFWGSTWARESIAALVLMTAAVLVMHIAARAIAARKILWTILPVSLVCIAVLVLATGSVLGFTGFGDVGSIAREGSDYLFGGELTGKISEAEPIYVGVNFFSSLGLFLLLSLMGLVLLVRLIERDGMTDGRLLFLVWTVAALLLTIGQKRFLYIFAINGAVLMSLLFFEAWSYIKERQIFRSSGSARSAAGLLLAAIIFLPSLEGAVSISGESPSITGDWYESLNWLKENTPKTSFFSDPKERAEYSVMSWWDYGNWILYQGERPVVANNFQAGVMDSARFLLSENETESCEIMDARGSKYVITDLIMIYGKLGAIASWLNEDVSTYQRVIHDGSGLVPENLDRLNRTTLARLHLGDCSGLGRFRLIYESNSFGGPETDARVKIFEYVKGAVIRGTAPEGKKIGVLLDVTSNQGRPFQYFSYVNSADGYYELLVPYPTASYDGIYPLGPYKVFDINHSENRLEAGKVQYVAISEEDVVKGNVIEVNF